jgi:hypothetical protein
MGKIEHIKSNFKRKKEKSAAEGQQMPILYGRRAISEYFTF